MSFSDLGLSPKVVSAVTAAGFETPTPIQAQAIPIAVTGRDVLGIAQTGTGKTASFVLPMLTRLERGRARARMPRTLILEPTRELAAQVAESFELLGKNHKLTMALLIGGVSYVEQDKKLDRGADVVIATPGRLLDHFERGKLMMNGIEILVVDEADRMLDMGFIPDIERICKKLPFTRQTLFFSATMPPEIQRLADNFLHNPERIEVSPPSTAAATIVQRLKKAPDDPAGKRLALRELMQEVDVRNAIIFCNRKKDVGVVFRSLQRHGFNVGALHGDLDQRERTTTLEAFRNGTIAFLAASDVAARGLDIPDVSHIFNYDVPVHPEDYIHRIGRTGRAGREGFAAMLVTPRDTKALKAIEKMLGQEIAWVDGSPSPEERAQAESSEQSDGRRRRGGRSRGGKAAGPKDPNTKGASANGADTGLAQADTPKPQEAAAAAPQEPAARPQEAPKAQEAAVSGNGRHENKPRDAKPRDDERRNGGRDRNQGERKQGRSGQSGQDRSQDRNKGSQQTRGKQQTGMGDHVPAFMMRPVRLP
ncbi:MAG TPA: DEAD/DEAH box helicase [Methyloceanibacter sp.]|nr:DEAD/DEAH box helicase [Methyloceanibacter sp.]